ncbi:hypothetical protein ACQ4PT_049943 [Festuca glaucescens]
MGEAEEAQSLALTPTWVVAAVCLIIVAISLAAERLLHRLGKACTTTCLHCCSLPNFSALPLITYFPLCSNSMAKKHCFQPCRKSKKGEVPMLSEEALHQLHIFIFVLGVVHVLFCVATLVLGGAKMRKWDKWEKEIHQGRLKEREKGSSWMKSSALRWIVAFFKQFYNSVGNPDYQVLRAAFVQLVLIVGTKLEYISTRLAQEAAECSDEATANPWNKPCKEHFWFRNPRVVLHLIHFILFQNSFEMGFFFWVLATYGFDSCIMENKSYALPRLAIGIVVQVLCSYSTLPLYAIVTHMGGDIKLQAFGEHVHVSVHSWATDVKKKSTSLPAHTHAHAHAHQHQHPHQHLRIPFLSKKRHSSRRNDAEEAAAEARAAQHLAESSSMPTAPPQPIDGLEEIVTTTEEDHRRRHG